MLYTARGNHAKGFILTDNSDTTLGTIQYAGWFSRSARLTLYNNDAYTVNASGFWMTSFDIQHAEIKTGEIKMNLRGKIAITLNGGQYIYQRQGFFNRGFILYNQDGQQMATTRQRYEWSKLGFMYEIDWDPGSQLEDMPILMLLVVYAANQQYSRAGTG